MHAYVGYVWKDVRNGACLSVFNFLCCRYRHHCILSLKLHSLNPLLLFCVAVDEDLELSDDEEEDDKKGLDQFKPKKK